MAGIPPKLIVMLTHHDCTVQNAIEIFEQCQGSRAEIWGFKEKGLPLEEMKALAATMKACGKTTVLEVVAYEEAECLDGAKMAAECGCDILMGTLFYDSVHEFCKEHHLKYMPFVGQVRNRPSVLDGTVEEMIDEAKRYLEKGVYGIDLLGYRYVGDAAELIQKFVSNVNAPVCVAGSIHTDARVEEVKKMEPWAFTIGGAFFEHKFGETMQEQIEHVCRQIETVR